MEKINFRTVDPVKKQALMSQLLRNELPNNGRYRQSTFSLLTNYVISEEKGILFPGAEESALRAKELPRSN